ncbi:hypothetical protein [Rhizobacter sp. P5_C2]
MTSRQPEDSDDARLADELGDILKVPHHADRPNEKTVAAMLEAREIAEAHRARFSSAEEFFSELEIGGRD